MPGSSASKNDYKEKKSLSRKRALILVIFGYEQRKGNEESGEEGQPLDQASDLLFPERPAQAGRQAADSAHQSRQGVRGHR